MPCPHFDIAVVQRSEGQSAVAAAAYQSGEKLYSQYDKETKSYDAKEGITHPKLYDCLYERPTSARSYQLQSADRASGHCKKAMVEEADRNADGHRFELSHALSGR